MVALSGAFAPCGAKPSGRIAGSVPRRALSLVAGQWPKGIGRDDDVAGTDLAIKKY